MKLFICPNGFTKKQSEQAKTCVSILEKNNECALSEKDSFDLFNNTSYARFTPEASDLIVSLGGDGSLLRAAQVAIKYEKPLIGINSGRLGYLCAINLNEVENFNKLLETLTLSKRTLLEFNHDSKTLYVLNDIVIAKSNFGETINLKIIVDKEEPVTLRGDGLIISTPTGSTAYNLSAGGPILDSNLNALALTPICPHQSFMRSVVIKDDQVIKVTLESDLVKIYSDGNKVGVLDKEMIIKKSSRSISIYSHSLIAKSINTFS